MLFATASELLARRRFVQVALLFTLLFSLFPLALGQDQDQAVRIARISLIEGQVSYQRAGDAQNDWFDASLNLPLNERDQIYSGPDGRVEIQLSGRNLVRIDRQTNLRFSQFNTGTVQFALPVGTGTFRVDSLDRRQFNIVDVNDVAKDDPIYFEVDTPIVAITFLKEGNYRVNVNDDGTTEIIVRRGEAEVFNREIGTVTVKQGRRLVIDGRDANYFQIARLEDKDNWDRWNDRRDEELFARAANSRSAQYIPAAVPGIYDLDNYGDWISTPDYGWVWYPRAAAVGWAPYRAGYWRYYSGWGWTWVSYEPWGWVPYHYGRWAWYGSRWCWVPSVSFGWRWSPHLVTFFGWGGGGYNRGYRDGYYDGYRDGRYGWYGWCPLGPRDRYYGHNSRTLVNNNVRSLDNYNAPGGVSLMESRRFDQGRVLVSRNEIRNPGEIKLPPAPPRGQADSGGDSSPRVLRSDDFKPAQAAPSRELKVERAEIARRLESPVIERRPVPGVNRTGAPLRDANGAALDSRSGRDVQSGDIAPNRNAPSRSSEATAAPPTRIQDGQVVRPDRMPRQSEYQTVDRIPAPTRSLPETERNAPSRESVEPSRSTPTPSRNADQPSRSEPPRRVEAPSRSESPRQYEPPPRPQVERREMPRNEPRESAPRRESPPARVERAPSPPPRESAPARVERSPERSSPPSRETPPSRPSRPDKPSN